MLDQLKMWLLMPIWQAGGSTVTVWTCLAFVAALVLVAITGKLTRSYIVGKFSLEPEPALWLSRAIQLPLLLLLCIEILDLSEIDITAAQIFAFLDGLLRTPIIPVGKEPITFYMIIFVGALGFALVYATGQMQQWTVRMLCQKKSIEVGLAQSITAITRYVIIALGLVVILQLAGIDLSTVTVLAGALGIGVGLGLQSVVANLVSGLLIMFERPVKVGDRIEVNDVTGDVQKIGLRATTIRSNRNIEVIVPNSEFICGNVINWTHSTKDVRVDVPVGVSYECDPEVARQCLLRAAQRHEGVLENPKPDVMFDSFGDNALNFCLRVYTLSYVKFPRKLTSELNFLIFDELSKESIEIPYPQQDIRIRSSRVVREVQYAINTGLAGIAK